MGSAFRCKASARRRLEESDSGGLAPWLACVQKSTVNS